MLSGSLRRKLDQLNMSKTKYGIDAKPDASAIVGVAESRIAGSQISNDNTEYKGVTCKRSLQLHDSSKYEGGKLRSYMD
jgi:hypothetical protein